MIGEQNVMVFSIPCSRDKDYRNDKCYLACAHETFRLLNTISQMINTRRKLISDRTGLLLAVFFVLNVY